jgi:hypothetical protein
MYYKHFLYLWGLMQFTSGFVKSSRAEHLISYLVGKTPNPPKI